ncbi:MAG: Dabb family protein [Marinilabiliaceae bacterium]|nr:Dabb family protein [Marinilabiliaceae bacterium]
MVKHIVLFKFKDFRTAQEKLEKLNEVKHALLSLTDKIECLLSVEVGLNNNPNETFDLALTTSFNSFEDIDIYAKHPDHLEVAKLIAPIKADRACVDYIM